MRTHDEIVLYLVPLISCGVPLGASAVMVLYYEIALSEVNLRSCLAIDLSANVTQSLLTGELLAESCPARMMPFSGLSAQTH